MLLCSHEILMARQSEIRGCGNKAKAKMTSEQKKKTKQSYLIQPTQYVQHRPNERNVPYVDYQPKEEKKDSKDLDKDISGSSNSDHKSDSFPDNKGWSDKELCRYICICRVPASKGQHEIE